MLGCVSLTVYMKDTEDAELGKRVAKLKKVLQARCRQHPSANSGVLVPLTLLRMLHEDFVAIRAKPQ